jgi:isoleucyl-tRNA synthetase
MFKVNKFQSISEREDQTTKWWKQNHIFEKSIAIRPEDKHYSFLDGPPFVTGMPHYGHLVGRIAKDVIPRYKTMKGYRVRRVWGWDCHGLPIEEKVERKIGLKNKRDIEKFGVNNFLNECKKYVDEVSSEWEWYVDKIGEWIDFTNSYKTMEKDYTESVIWVFKQLWDKGLIYEGVKTLLYCTRCGTPISKFEIAMDDSYTDMEDPAVTIEFPITTKGEFEGSRLLAWTTTPWTMPSNRALVVDPKEIYVEFTTENSHKQYILAKKRIETVLAKSQYKLTREFEGKQLLGLNYEAPYNFIAPNEKDWKVYEYPNFVNMEEGTGIVHSAPGFGEIDTAMGQHYNLKLMFTVDEEGKFIDEIKDFAGLYVKEADEKIIADLKDKGKLFKAEKITHRYPFCYRCQTPLIQKAQKSWFINIQKIKNQLIENNKKINWVPNKLVARAENNLNDAPDWCISRTRYWATIMPVWMCSECKEYEVFGSINDIEERSGQKIENLHRNGVDHIEFECKKCKGKMRRIPEVLDVWLDSASMPYAQIHYPFENEDLFRQTFPGDYIIEYVGQIRAWFYVMHVISNALLGENSYKNVVVTGTMAGTDGRKMSKSLGNYPDPKETLEKYGGDAIRLYFMGSNIMLGEDPNFDETELKNQVNSVIFPLWNSFRYFVTYANIQNWKPKSLEEPQKVSNELDNWILARLKNFHDNFESNLAKYFMPNAAREISPFINDLSTWYIRRSRDRFIKGDTNAISTLYYVLVQTIKIIAPITPFVSEEIYKSLVVEYFSNEPDSVHLCDYPKLMKVHSQEQNILTTMHKVRQLASLGQAIRVSSGIKLRQPLQSAQITILDTKATDWIIEILKDELNVKEVIESDTTSHNAPEGFVSNEDKKAGVKITMSLNLTDELIEEGLYRELIRNIQAFRKKQGLKFGEKISLSFQTDSHELKKVITKNKKELMQDISAAIITEDIIEGTEINVNTHKITIKINPAEID